MVVANTVAYFYTVTINAVKSKKRYKLQTGGRLEPLTGQKLLNVMVPLNLTKKQKFQVLMNLLNIQKS
jgi:hypothetical protein